MSNHFLPQQAAENNGGLTNGQLGLRAAKAVAADHGVDPITVWRWARAGLLEVVRIANRPYITMASLAEFHRKAAAGELARPLAGAAKKSAETRAGKQAQVETASATEAA